MKKIILSQKSLRNYFTVKNSKLLKKQGWFKIKPVTIIILVLLKKLFKKL